MRLTVVSGISSLIQASGFSVRKYSELFGRIDYDDKHVYAERLTKEQVQDLPEFSEDLAINNDYEERVRSLSSVSGNINLSPLYNADPYDYDQEPYFYNYNDQNLRLYEERLRGKGTVAEQIFYKTACLLPRQSIVLTIDVHLRCCDFCKASSI